MFAGVQFHRSFRTVSTPTSGLGYPLGRIIIQAWLTYFLTTFVEEIVGFLQRMKKLFILFLLLAVVVPVLGQQPAQPAEKKTPEPQAGTVKWMTFEEAIERSKTEKRKIFIDVYTDWCGWCKVMDKTTFSEENVAKILNDKFYPVKFNAEQRADVVFAGHTFKFIPSGNSGVHELAAALLKNQLSYPTVVFLDENFAMIQPLPGYQKAPAFHPIIQFIGEDHWKKMKWAEFQSVYKSPYTESQGNGSGH